MGLDQTGDPHGRIGLPVAPASPDILAPTKLLNNDFLGTELVDNGTDHLSTLDLGGPNGRSRRIAGD